MSALRLLLARKISFDERDYCDCGIKNESALVADRRIQLNEYDDQRDPPPRPPPDMLQIGRPRVNGDRLHWEEYGYRYDTCFCEKVMT